MNFLKNVFAVVVGMVIFTGILFGLGTMLIIGIAASSGGEQVEVKKNSILKISLNNQIVEKADADNPFNEMNLPFGGGMGKIGLIEIVESIKKAKTDKNIKGIYLDASSVNGGFASLEVIRNALIDFKTSGKFIVAYAEVMSEGAYYLASVSDEIYLYPQGMLEFNGLHSEVMFFTGLFEKLGIEVNIFKVGDFKSAVEPFFRKDMSDYNRQQVTSFLNSMYNHYLRNVSASISKPYEDLKLVSDSMLIREASDAVKYGLVTKLAYWDEVEAILKQKTDSTAEELNFIALNKYMSKNKNQAEEGKSKDNKIAVIVAQGDIISGESDEESMGSETIAAAIRKARLDEDVKAIVLRVNSPGGSALASDVMWREVMLTKKVKPIIASMSDVAASGGYYISMGCDTIVAEPNTITGSIGVFGMMPNMESFFNDKLGLTFDRVKTGEFSDLPNINRSMTDYEKMTIQNEVNKIYEDFTLKASQGRKMPHDSLKKVASGRVWSGLEAKEVGLVDVLGGLDKAISLASERAKIDSNYQVVYYPKEKDFFAKLFNIEEEVKAMIYAEETKELQPYLNQIKNLKKYQGVQTRMPYELNIIQ